jgi:hypothetical protein
LPGTTIEDTPDARAILNVMERYRTALEHGDAQGVLALVSPDFRDTGGTPNPEDDLDYQSLQRVLPQRLGRIQDLHVDIDVRSIDFHKGMATGNEATAIYYYSARFRMPTLTARGQNESDLKQMTFRRENDQWKIVSGL